MKRLKLLVLLLFVVQLVVGQDTVFYSFYGTTGDDIFTKAFASGDSLIFFGSTDNGTNQSDLYVIKTDRDQTNFRSKKIGTSAIEFLVDIDFDSVSSKYYALINYYSGFNATEYDYAVVVLDSEFNELNRKVFELDGFQEGVLIRKIQSELFVGYQFEDSTKVIALDSVLNPQFEFLATRNSIKDIRQFDDHVYVLSDSATINQQLDICLAKYDLNYNFENALLIGNSLDEIASSLASFNSGILIAGSSSSFNLPGDFDAIICYVDTNDTLVWMWDHGFSTSLVNKNDFGKRVLNFRDSILFLGIETSTYGLGGRDYQYLVLDTNGNYLFGHSFGSEQNEKLYSIEIISQNELLITGATDNGEIGATDFYTVRTTLITPPVYFKKTSLYIDSSGVKTLGTNENSEKIDCRILRKDLDVQIFGNSNILEVQILNFQGQVQKYYSGINNLDFTLHKDDLGRQSILVVKMIESECVLKMINQK